MNIFFSVYIPAHMHAFAFVFAWFFKLVQLQTIFVLAEINISHSIQEQQQQWENRHHTKQAESRQLLCEAKKKVFPFNFVVFAWSVLEAAAAPTNNQLGMGKLSSFGTQKLTIRKTTTKAANEAPKAGQRSSALWNEMKYLFAALS